MGPVVRGGATNGGYVHGIIPEALVSRERTTEEINEKLNAGIDNHNGSTPIPDSNEYGKTILVKDMHTRKRMMGQEADAFVALPGGHGTLEALMEVVTWHQLNIHSKPIILFSIDVFYNNILEFIQDSIDSEFVSKKNGEIITVVHTAEEVIEAIEGYVVPDGRLNLNWDTTYVTID